MLFICSLLFSIEFGLRKDKLVGLLDPYIGLAIPLATALSIVLFVLTKKDK